MSETVPREEDSLGKGLGDSPPHRPLVTQSLHPALPIPLLLNNFSSCWPEQGWQSVYECMLYVGVGG